MTWTGSHTPPCGRSSRELSGSGAPRRRRRLEQLRQVLAGAKPAFSTLAQPCGLWAQWPFSRETWSVRSWSTSALSADTCRSTPIADTPPEYRRIAVNRGVFA